MSCRPHDTSSGDGGASDSAKLQLNSELATIESNYFLSNQRLQR